jgi:hypothetical protein
LHFIGNCIISPKKGKIVKSKNGQREERNEEGAQEVVAGDVCHARGD